MLKEQIKSDLKNISNLKTAKGAETEISSASKMSEFLKHEIEKAKYTARGESVPYNPFFQNSLTNLIFQVKVLSYSNLISLIIILIFNALRNIHSILIPLVIFSSGLAFILISINIYKISYSIWKYRVDDASSSLNLNKASSQNIYCDKKSQRLQPFVLILITTNHDLIDDESYKNNRPKYVPVMILFLSFALVFNIIPIISILLAADSVFLIYIPSSISFLFYVACGMVVSHIINQKLIEINLRESNNGTGLAIMLNSMRYFSSTDLNWSDLRFLFCPGKDLSYFGLKTHLKVHEDEIKKYFRVFVLNIDNIYDSISFNNYNSLNVKSNILDETIKNSLVEIKIASPKKHNKPIISRFKHLEQIYLQNQGIENARVYSEKSDENGKDTVNHKTLVDVYELVNRIILNIDRYVALVIESGTKSLK